MSECQLYEQPQRSHNFIISSLLHTKMYVLNSCKITIYCTLMQRLIKGLVTYHVRQDRGGRKPPLPPLLANKDICLPPYPPLDHAKIYSYLTGMENIYGFM